MDEDRVMEMFRGRRRRVLRSAVLVALLVLTALGLAHTGSLDADVTAIILVGSFAWALVVNVKLWRCPSCEGHLGKLYPGLREPRFCPQCGIRLIDDEGG